MRNMDDKGKLWDVCEKVLKQQAENDPILRTLDLQNPFDSSLRTNPTYLGNTVSTETVEFVFPRQ